MAIEFNTKGNLKKNYTLSINDFKTQFIDNFPFYNRKIIFEEIQSYLKQIFSLHNEPYLKIWVDGSFVTDEIEPNDIDFVIFIYHIFDNVEKKLSKFDNSNRYIDAYFIPFFSDNIITNDLITYWRRHFSIDRNGNKKGFIELNITILDENIEDY